MSYEIDLRGRRALVCGASSGLGAATARCLARAGCEVSVLARRASKLEALCAELVEGGAPAAHGVEADMDQLLDFARSVQDHLQEIGGVHICVHNTGGPAAGPILEKTEEDLVEVFSRHQLTAHFLVRSLLPFMQQEGYGRFVQILSTSAREPIANLGLSNSIRAGMVGWAKTVSRELPPGITINNVLPGYIGTDRLAHLKEALSQRSGRSPEQIEESWVEGIPEGRLGEATEIGEAILFLASPLASYIRGVSLPVEGGRMMGL